MKLVFYTILNHYYDFIIKINVALTFHAQMMTIFLVLSNFYGFFSLYETELYSHITEGNCKS